MTEYKVVFANIVDSNRVYLLINLGREKVWVKAIAFSPSSIKAINATTNDYNTSREVDSITPGELAVRIMEYSRDNSIPIFATCRRLLEECIKFHNKRVPVLDGLHGC